MASSASCSQPCFTPPSLLLSGRANAEACDTGTRTPCDWAWGFIHHRRCRSPLRTSGLPPCRLSCPPPSLAGPCFQLLLEGNEEDAQGQSTTVQSGGAEAARPRLCKTTALSRRAPPAGSRAEMISPRAPSVAPPRKTAVTSKDECAKSRDCPLRVPSSTSSPLMAP